MDAYAQPLSTEYEEELQRHECERDFYWEDDEDSFPHRADPPSPPDL